MSNLAEYRTQLKQVKKDLYDGITRTYTSRYNPGSGGGHSSSDSTSYSDGNH